MILEIIISVAIILILFTFVFFLSKKPILNYFQSLSQKITEESLKSAEQKSKEILKDERERIKEQYNAEKEILEEKMQKEEQFIDNKKDSIKELIDKLHQELNKNQEKLESTEKERISEFSSLKTVLDDYKIITSGLKESTDSLKNVLSNNQLRGKYGEEVAENLLKSVGFVKGQNYIVNTSQDTVSSRPDFTMLLPDKTKINIDAKFPLQSLIKYQGTNDKLEKEKYLREFTKDVKEKVKQVATRDYINPEEKTVDFVIMFVPNEMIFSFIYDNLNDVWNDAMKKKVIMAGPFSFTAILRMVFQSYKNFKYQENIFEIIKLIKLFEQEYENFSRTLDVLGKKIQSVSSQYNIVSVTRNKKLDRILTKIKGENISPSVQDRDKLMKLNGNMEEDNNGNLVEEESIKPENDLNSKDIPF